MPRKPASDGRQQLRIGTRTDNRVFKFNTSWSAKDVDRVKENLQDVYAVCGGWNDLSNSIAESLRKGITPVPLPDIHLAMSVDGKSRLFQVGKLKFDTTADTRIALLNESNLLWWERQIKTNLPNINWASLSTTTEPPVLASIRQREMNSLQRSADSIAAIDNRPATQAIATKGTLHQAMRKYDEYVKADQPTNFDRHSKIKQLIERSTDIPLAMLDIEQCRTLIDYWRSRPDRHDGKGKYSAKRSREQLAELYLFFRHTHTSKDFAWRMPEDLQLLKRTTNKDEKKNLSFIPIKLFTVDELRRLITNGTLIQKLITTWCLNCSHGAAEIGRVTWGDLYLNQDHPWRSQGLQIDPGGNWTGFLRHKTDVVGWWHLWPETVELIKLWKPEAEKILGRNVTDSDRLILTESGEPMYRDNTKNAQSTFASEFKALRKVSNVSKLPFGTLRDQLSDWISTKKGDAVAASVALAHGIPHKEDKLLFAHYSNRPWKNLFDYQKMFRENWFPEKQEGQ